MNHSKAMHLVDDFLEIRRLTTVLDPLVDIGREDLARFNDEFETILGEVFPTYTVAVTGPVGSGKSTFLTSLLQEAGAHPLASIGPSNETFAPMTITYGENATLVAKYFSAQILQNIEEHLISLENTRDQPHLIAQYREIRKRLREVPAVLAGEEQREVVKRVSLGGLSRQDMTRVLKNHVAQSSNSPDVYGVYKVEITYPGAILKELRNVRFTDLYGFGEPSPLINIKYSRFVQEEPLDAVIYVFPYRSITEDFYRLFDIPSFYDEIVKNRRLFLVLNKADSYTDAGINKWPNVVQSFREALSRHVPAIKAYAKEIPIVVMSAASIDGKIPHQGARAIREASLQGLQGLRNELRKLSAGLERSSADLSIYLGTAFDLLEVLDILARGVELNLQQLETKLPGVSQVIDDISRRHLEFEGERSGRLEGFRGALEQEVVGFLTGLQYDNLIKLNTSSLEIGDPQKLFRWMVEQSQIGAKTVFARQIVGMFKNFGAFVDINLLRAYRDYVALQDNAAIEEILSLSGRDTRSMKPLSTTVENAAQEFVNFSGKPGLHLGVREIYERFVGWYLRNKCKWNAERGQGLSEVKKQILSNLEMAVETFVRVFVYEDKLLTASFCTQICVGGELTFWKQIERHIERMEKVLSEQIKITKWKFGLYQSKTFFVSNKPQYQETVKELLLKKSIAQERIVELA